MRIEAIDDEDPFSVGVGVHGACDVLHELGFSTSRFQCGRENQTGDHVEPRRQRRRAMTCIFKLLLDHTAGLNGFVRGISFDGLQRGRFVDTHRVSSVEHSFRGCFKIGLTDDIDFELILLGILLRRVEPHLCGVVAARPAAKSGPLAPRRSTPRFFLRSPRLEVP